MTIHMKLCKREDIQTLQAIGIETFDDTFRAMNDPEVMDAYLEKAFALEKLEKELANEDSYFYFIYSNGELAGYLKLNINGAQTDRIAEDALEVERIYVRRGFKGQGLGKHLIKTGEELARTNGKKQIWLGVWEKNDSAIGFYKTMGFVPHGTHTFVMGNEEQTDYTLIKSLE